MDHQSYKTNRVVLFACPYVRIRIDRFLVSSGNDCMQILINFGA
jgi:hypothetical protein